MLQRQGIVDLEFRIAKEKVKQYTTEHMVDVLLNDHIRIAYDTLDGYNWEPDAKPLSEFLQEVDFYFKRSFSPERNQALEYGSRIYPLGLYYQVITQHPIFDRVQGYSRMGLGRRIKRRLTGYYHRVSVEQFEDVPRPSSTQGKVVFLTRAWNPDGNKREGPDRWGYRFEERKALNAMRAGCIRQLRAAFGERFIGGFEASPVSQEFFPDCVAADWMTKKSSFMALVKQADACVTTMGLHESTGSKMAEYVIASKAIAAERLRFQASGDFGPGRNYLEFETPEECVERVNELLDDPERAYQMRVHNYQYYLQYLRPDRLVLNSLLLALEKSSY